MEFPGTKATALPFELFATDNLLFVSFVSKQDQVETTTLMVERDGLYDVSVHKMLSESELKPETVFECLLTIPGTGYAAREETMYFPGKGNHRK